MNGAVETWTSWLPAGPTTPRIRELDARRSATWIACAVSGNCVSPTTARNFVRCDLLYRLTQNRAHLPCCEPIEAAAPVIGAATPIVLVRPQVISVRSVTVGDWAVVVDPPAVPAATASAVSAVSADRIGSKAFLILPPCFPQETSF